ncbi:hypothetical protein QYS48_17950 [Marivirga arenosa]|uniref:DUF3037 domain-containing protein n=1 Tax=Marivirga arenosa TaxID=3059076 RepID=A0AA49GFA8_9BACT|nr:hypothetical protein [Marivirga sp. ABR2-2]WKK84091.1 hypothetical protein QYS48_17950 [Marivirga sp. ABR2-2]
MKTLYSIIFSPLSVVGHERINFALLMLNSDGEVFYNYSAEKLKLAKKLYSNESFKLLTGQLESLRSKLDQESAQLSHVKAFNSEYLDYLSRYSNNMIAFTKPMPIKIEFNQKNFETLFERIIYKSKPSIKDELLTVAAGIAQIKRDFSPKVKSRVNIDVELKADELDFILFNTHIDMIGRNDKPVLNQFIEFENDSPAKIEKNINSYLSLIKPFEMHDGKEGKYFIVGDEPSKSKKQHHLIWEHLRESNLLKKDLLELVPSKEIDAIETYLNEHDVKPYFKDKE